VFGCLSSAIIGASRLGLPMSEDAPAFRWMSRIHPRYKTPTAGIVTLGVWSMLLVLTGSYEQLFQYALFSSIIFHVITAWRCSVSGDNVRTQPRPYRVVGYPGCRPCSWWR
jgi:APA family basic amino acid/polyamine antiporter